MRTAWIGVACAEHVGRGRAGGFMQVCHGKAGPLRRLGAGDGVVYYSPTVAFGSREPCRAFTAVGIVSDGEPYAVVTGGTSRWRRDVAWAETQRVPIVPLLPHLALTAGQRDWGAPFRFGLVEIDPADWRTIAGGGLTPGQP